MPLIDDKTYPKYRYVILLLFSLNSFLNGAAWLTFAAFPSVIENAYNVNEHLINSMSYSYFITFILMNFPSVSVYDKFGFKKGILIGTLFNLLGVILKTLIN